MKKLLTGLVLVPLVIAGCSGGKGKSEKERYTEAAKESICMILKSGDAFDPANVEKAKEVFKKYGFDVSDEAALKDLDKKYDGDKEVEDAIEQAVKDCSGDLTKVIEDSGIKVEATPVK